MEGATDLRRPSIDHICIGVRNHYGATTMLFDLAALRADDGGWYPQLGVGQRWIALQNGRLEFECVIDRQEAQASNLPDGRNLLDATAQMDAFVRWGITGDVTRNAKRTGFEARTMVRRLADGAEVTWRVVPDPWDAHFLGMPVITDFNEHMTGSHAPSDAVISKVEVGGDKALIQGWIGDGVEDLPIDYVGGPPGVRAVTLRLTSGREIALSLRDEVVATRIGSGPRLSASLSEG